NPHINCRAIAAARKSRCGDEPGPPLAPPLRRGRKGANMKKLAVLSGILLAATLGTTPSAHAGSRTGFVVPVETEVNGVKLEPGIYRLNWQGKGSDTRVSFVR